MSLSYFSLPDENRQKEQLYLEVRSREDRVLTDEQLLDLPVVRKPAARAREWRWRKRSFQRLDNYLNNRYPNRPIRVLDLGCGNGWMSNLLATNPLRTVTAVDVNEPELEQARRVFQRENLQFVYGDVMKGGFQAHSFDVIVLAASVQYFPHLPELISVLKRLLASNGEIHILDSPFYIDKMAAMAARKRTKAYYEQLGVPEMDTFYHHHLWQEARELRAVDLNSGFGTSLSRWLKYLGPFPWLRIV